MRIAQEEADRPSLAIPFDRDLPSIKLEGGNARPSNPGDLESVGDKTLLNTAVVRIVEINEQLDDLGERRR